VPGRVAVTTPALMVGLILSFRGVMRALVRAVSGCEMRMVKVPGGGEKKA